MKKIFSLFLIFSMVTISYGQETISFDFAIEQNGNQLRLDSVLIENIDLSADTTLYFPNTKLELEVPSNIISFGAENTFEVSQNYPNPFEHSTNIQVYSPTNESLTISVFDNSGRILNSYDTNINRGNHIFEFIPGSQQNYIVTFSIGKVEKSIKLLHTGSASGNSEIKYIGETNITKSVKQKTPAFSFSFGDNLRFTGYTTICNQVDYIEINDSPTESIEYFFDFTGITEIQPEKPEVVEIIESETSITWKWNISSVPIGFKVSSENDYSEAIDIGNETEFSETDLIAGTNYQLFVWAYNDCGQSFPLEMHKATTAIPLTEDEIDLITEDESNQAMVLMNIFEQPDSIILRTPSTNIILDDVQQMEYIEHLADRMYRTAVSIGVGIAAPQVGINRRVIWVQRYDLHPIIGQWRVFYNPRITQYSDEFVMRNDGCLSVPQNGEYPEIEGYSYRATWIEVEYWDADGEYHKEIITHQFTAHIFQHEIDHLDGIMYFDLQELEKRVKNYTIVDGECYDEVLQRIRNDN